MSASLTNAIIGSSPQVFSSDIRDCGIRKSVSNAAVMARGTQQPEAVEIFDRLEALGLKQRDLARALRLEENKVSKAKAGERLLKAGEVLKAREWLTEIERKRKAGIALLKPDLPVIDSALAYVPIDIMPTYAGMGGGGTGEGDIERALVPRYLIESVFRGHPSDFVIVRTRGDSMSPDFEHDDELLCDKRDRNPVQPGPFAVWDAEDQAYVVKNVEKMESGRFRIFSTNPKYTPARDLARGHAHHWEARMVRTAALIVGLLAIGGAAKAQLRVERQLAQIDRTFVCPESLPSDDAREAAARLFMEELQAIQPDLTIREVVTYRERLLRKHNCVQTLEYEREHARPNNFR